MKPRKQTRFWKFKQFLLHEIEIFRFIFLGMYIVFGGFLFASKTGSKLEFSHTELDMAQDLVIKKLNELNFKVEGMFIHQKKECKFGNIRNLLRNRAKDLLENYDLLTETRNVDWGYGIAMYYSFVQITTIGYGDYVPTTKEAMILTVLYTAIGIPICISVFIKLGNLFALSLYNSWKLIQYKVQMIFKKKGVRKSYSKNPRNIGLVFLINVYIAFIALCSFVLPFFSNLGYIDSFYFFFITMSTIGFGDIYPTRSSYFIVIFLTCFGIGLTSNLFSNIRKRMQQRLESYIIIYVNEIAKQDSIKRIKPDPKEAGLEAKEKNSSFASLEDIEEDEVYVVDFERCAVM